MAADTRNLGIAFFLSIAIVGAASLSARLYKDQLEAKAFAATVLQSSDIVCR